MARVKLSQQVRRAVFNKTGGLCYLCNDAIDYNLPAALPGSYEVEHIVPLASGGTNEISNLLPAHRVCNGVKGSGTVDAALSKIRLAKGASRNW